jgi:alpha-glucosidase
VATVLTFTSPFMCLAVNPEELLALPVKEMITSMPTTWDETIVLPPSEIGQISVYARRKGTTWYLAAINGEDVKDLEINLWFLRKGRYRTTIMEDYKDAPEKSLVTNKRYTGTNKITLTLQSGGGFVARFTKI